MQVSELLAAVNARHPGYLYLNLGRSGQLAVMDYSWTELQPVIMQEYNHYSDVIAATSEGDAMYEQS